MHTTWISKHTVTFRIKVCPGINNNIYNKWQPLTTKHNKENDDPVYPQRKKKKKERGR